MRLRGRVLIVSTSARHQPAALILKSADYDVNRASSIAEARSFLRLHRTDVLIVDLLEFEARVALGLAREGKEHRAQTLGLSRSDRDDDLRALLDAGVTNFLAVGQDDEVDPLELVATVTKIQTGDIFGLEHYFGGSPRFEALVVSTAADKRRAADVAEAFAQKAGCHSQAALNIAQAADELLSNAIRSSGACARDGLEPVTMRLGTDGRRLGLSVTDGTGALEPNRIVEYLRRCLRKGDDQVEWKESGAGLGLYETLQMVQHFVFNIAPGRRTEAIGLIRITRSFREFSSVAKSFNLFVAGS